MRGGLCLRWWGESVGGLADGEVHARRAIQVMGVKSLQENMHGRQAARRRRGVQCPTKCTHRQMRKNT